MYSEKPCKVKSRKWLENYKSENCCLLCGWNEYPLILEFHHPEGRKKRLGGKKETSSFVGRNFGIKTMETKVKELILLCPNCHKWIHYKQKYEK